MDKTRKFDLEEVWRQRERAKSYAERDNWDKLLFKIANESIPIRSMREELIGAMRVGDRSAIRKISNRIRIEEGNHDLVL